MKFNWRKWNRATHRDLGYIFFAVTVVYAISGIAINHLNDWNPNYVITTKEVQVALQVKPSELNKEAVIKILFDLGEKNSYKKHYFPSSNQLKVFIEGGNLLINLDSGKGWFEKIKRRPVFHAVNYLHYNPGKWWTLFSDVYCVALFILALSGLFILKGRNGIKKRGAILTLLGIAIPVLFLLLFY